MAPPSNDTFPRQNARTQRFTLGRPRTCTVSPDDDPDGGTVLFVRAASGADRVGRLWRWTATAGEVELVDPVALLAGEDEQLSDAERARRERAREAASGIVTYSVDANVKHAVFALSGRLFLTEVATGETVELLDEQHAAVVDPHIDPTGRRVAFASEARLRVLDLASGDVRTVSPDEAGDTADTVSWGTADFVSAEELDRFRGFWWSPDGEVLLAQRTDDSPVPTWYVSSPADPSAQPMALRYPAAGQPNPNVSLWVLPLDQAPIPVQLPDGAEYIATVEWTDRGDPIVSALDRPQQEITWLSVDATDGSTTTLRTVAHAQWVDVITGSGVWDRQGHLLTVEVVDDSYSLCLDGDPLTPAGLHVRAVLDVSADDILVLAASEAGNQEVWTVAVGLCERVSPANGWHAAARGGSTTVMVSSNLERPLPVATVNTPRGSYEINSAAATPMIEPRVTLLPTQSSKPRVAVLLPSGHTPGAGALPVLLDPYGGPHHASVAHHQGAFREAQWFADQGFAVVVIDGRGTPGSPSWERAVRHDFAGPVLEDQIVGLHAAAHAFTDLDLSRVAIRGWSFGGYLSALAVIDRPDVFHAAIAGAPVTDWRLYDTGYTERYLGVPADDVPTSLLPYERSSLLERAASLTRPLQIIHGLADDNVFIAHALRLSQVLTENGRPHEVLPLSGITHMATQEDVAENLLLLQVDFLRRALGLASSPR